VAGSNWLDQIQGATVSFITDVGPIVGSLRLTAVGLDFSTPIADLNISTALNQDLLVYALRYRATAQTFTTTSSKTLLVPGRYRLMIEGRSTAEHPEFSAHPELYPSAPSIDWRVEEEFETTYPETL